MLVLLAVCEGNMHGYRIASNLTDNSNYLDTIRIIFLPLITPAGQSMKFEFLLF